MERYVVTRIGDVTIQRVVPKEEIRPNLPLQDEEEEDDEGEEEEEEEDIDEEKEDEHLMPEDHEFSDEKEMDKTLPTQSDIQKEDIVPINENQEEEEEEEEENEDPGMEDEMESSRPVDEAARSGESETEGVPDEDREMLESLENAGGEVASVMDSSELLRNIKEEPMEQDGSEDRQETEDDTTVPNTDDEQSSDIKEEESSKRKQESDDETELGIKKKKPEDENEIDKKKALNMRRNIREVMDENQLDEATLAAQRQEMERLRRVQDQQKYLREVQRQMHINRQNHKTQSRVISLLQGNSSMSLLKGKSASTSTSTKPNTVLVKLGSDAPPQALNKKVLDAIRGDRSVSPPSSIRSGISRVLSNKHMVTPSVTIAPVKPASTSLHKDKKAPPAPDVVTILSSDEEDVRGEPRDREEQPPPLEREQAEPTERQLSEDDDCIVISEPSDEEEDDVDPTNSGMHTNDLYNTPDEQGRVLINVGKQEGEPEIYLAPQIARVIKPHQIGGIRFLFDNVVESVERFNNSTGFGCILAHSMGLGKTLQVVSFCDVFLRETPAKTVMCIMPINTLQNWMAEFNLWLPTDASTSPLAAQGEIRTRDFKIFLLNDLHKTIAARSRVVQEWRREGGVLLIGYEMYRQLSLKRPGRVRKGKKRPQNEDIEDDKNKPLLEDMHEALVKPGPDLVICDEGHRIKNSHASISHALKQIRTKRRVVLTGYPLQNNLLEYWCMVDFVRPNYLGTKTEFSNMFERPIQNGQCIDSTPQDIRLMRYRAHVLHSLLEGFVQRRSHSVLRNSLPQKEEYVLLVRLTAFQRRLYDTFMNEVVRTKAVPNPLKAFAVCCKIWNHPDILYNFLKKRELDELQDLDIDETAAINQNAPGTESTAASPRGKREKKGKNSKKAQAVAVPMKSPAVAAVPPTTSQSSEIKTEEPSKPQFDSNYNNNYNYYQQYDNNAQTNFNKNNPSSQQQAPQPQQQPQQQQQQQQHQQQQTPQPPQQQPQTSYQNYNNYNNNYNNYNYSSEGNYNYSGEYNNFNNYYQQQGNNYDGYNYSGQGPPQIKKEPGLELEFNQENIKKEDKKDDVHKQTFCRGLSGGEVVYNYSNSQYEDKKENFSFQGGFDFNQFNSNFGSDNAPSTSFNWNNNQDNFDRQPPYQNSPENKKNSPPRNSNKSGNKPNITEKVQQKIAGNQANSQNNDLFNSRMHQNESQNMYGGPDHQNLQFPQENEMLGFQNDQLRNTHQKNQTNLHNQENQLPGFQQPLPAYNKQQNMMANQTINQNEQQMHHGNQSNLQGNYSTNDPNYAQHQNHQHSMANQPTNLQELENSLQIAPNQSNQIMHANQSNQHNQPNVQRGLQNIQGNQDMQNRYSGSHNQGSQNLGLQNIAGNSQGLGQQSLSSMTVGHQQSAQSSQHNMLNNPQHNQMGNTSMPIPQGGIPGNPPPMHMAQGNLPVNSQMQMQGLGPGNPPPMQMGGVHGNHPAMTNNQGQGNAHPPSLQDGIPSNPPALQMTQEGLQGNPPIQLNQGAPSGTQMHLGNMPMNSSYLQMGQQNLIAGQSPVQPGQGNVPGNTHLQMGQNTGNSASVPIGQNPLPGNSPLHMSQNNLPPNVQMGHNNQNSQGNMMGGNLSNLGMGQQNMQDDPQGLHMGLQPPFGQHQNPSQNAHHQNIPGTHHQNLPGPQNVQASHSHQGLHHQNMNNPQGQSHSNSPNHQGTHHQSSTSTHHQNLQVPPPPSPHHQNFPGNPNAHQSNLPVNNPPMQQPSYPMNEIPINQHTVQNNQQGMPLGSNSQQQTTPPHNIYSNSPPQNMQMNQHHSNNQMQQHSNIPQNNQPGNSHLHSQNQQMMHSSSTGHHSVNQSNQHHSNPLNVAHPTHPQNMNLGQDMSQSQPQNLNYPQHNQSAVNNQQQNAHYDKNVQYNQSNLSENQQMIPQMSIHNDPLGEHHSQMPPQNAHLQHGGQQNLSNQSMNLQHSNAQSSHNSTPPHNQQGNYHNVQYKNQQNIPSTSQNVHMPNVLQGSQQNSNQNYQLNQQNIPPQQNPHGGRQQHIANVHNQQAQPQESPSQSNFPSNLMNQNNQSSNQPNHQNMQYGHQNQNNQQMVHQSGQHSRGGNIQDKQNNQTQNNRDNSNQFTNNQYRTDNNQFFQEQSSSSSSSGQYYNNTNQPYQQEFSQYQSHQQNQYQYGNQQYDQPGPSNFGFKVPEVKEKRGMSCQTDPIDKEDEPYDKAETEKRLFEQWDKEEGRLGGGKPPEEKEKREEEEKEKKVEIPPVHKAVKEEPGIPYDWATEILKGYIPGDINASAKMAIFFCILEESIALGDRILVFSQSLFTLNLMEELLQQQFVHGKQERWAKNVNYYRLDGSTTAIEREKLINEFNSNPNLHLFLVSTRAGSLGINLVGANRVIVFDASWNPCHDTQAVCRVYRYGQKKPCFVYRLVTDNCLEKKIYDRQINKQGMSDRVVDECNPDAHLSIKEVTSLCWDDKEDDTPRDFTALQDSYIDVVIQKVLQRHSSLLSKEPFQHESLLVDRKEKKLSLAEKRLAKRSYELEKQASTSTTRPPYYNNPVSGQGGIIRGPDKPMASVRPMQSELGSQLVRDGPRPRGWIPASVWQRQGMSAQEMTLPLDVVIPTNAPDRSSIVLKAGQKVMVLKSPKGIYMQLENGKIIAIRTAFKGKEKQESKKGVGQDGNRGRGGIPNLRNNNVTITPARPLANRPQRPVRAVGPVSRPPVTVTVTRRRSGTSSNSNRDPHLLMDESGDSEDDMMMGVTSPMQKDLSSFRKENKDFGSSVYHHHHPPPPSPSFPANLGPDVSISSFRVNPNSGGPSSFKVPSSRSSSAGGYPGAVPSRPLEPYDCPRTSKSDSSRDLEQKDSYRHLGGQDHREHSQPPQLPPPEGYHSAFQPHNALPSHSPSVSPSKQPSPSSNTPEKGFQPYYYPPTSNYYKPYDYPPVQTPNPFTAAAVASSRSFDSYYPPYYPNLLPSQYLPPNQPPPSNPSPQ